MPSFEKQGIFYLGKLVDPKTGKIKEEELLYKSKDLTTHAVCVGMTGSGKTGLGISMIEEAALDSIPSIIIDPKGDMGNILLTFPSLSADEFKPWIDRGEAERKGETLDAYAEEVAKNWKEGLKAWGETPKRIQDLRSAVSMEIYTPASRAGIPLSILTSFKAPSKEFMLDNDAMRERVLSTTSSLLGLLGIAADPIKSREHIMISTIIDCSWREGKDLDLADLIQQVQKPLFDKIGVLNVDTFFPRKERMALSIHLNNLLASPGFHAWMEGAPLDIQKLLYTPEKKPKISVISIAHLTDPERMFFVTLFLNELIAWTRKQPGTSSLRAIFYMDEIVGYFPPIAAPPSKQPMIHLLKQARAYGLGIMLCTQNPVDLDYKGLSNCGTWFIGRLQTARDKMRVIEGLAAASNGEIDSKAIDKLMSAMENRVFIMRSIYEKEPILFQTRWALSYLRGPLTLEQIELLTRDQKKDFKEKRSASEGKTKGGGKAVVPTSMSEYFVRTPKTSSSISYRPFIAGFAKIHFIDKKYNIDEWMNPCLVVEAGQGVNRLDWETAENHPDLKQQLAATPAEHALYEEVSSEILNEKNYSGFKRDFTSYLYQNYTLKISEFKELKLVSKPQESEMDFRLRISLALREQRDELCQKMRDQYEKKVTILKDKIRKAEGKKSSEQMQSWYQKFEAFLSMTTTIIGAVFGKKVTKTTINQAGTTFRRMGRMGKESQDVTNAEDNLKALQEQLDELQSQLEADIAKISTNIDASRLQLDEVTIKPLKTEIGIEQIALVWWP